MPKLERKMVEIYIDKSVAALRELHREVLETDRSQLTMRELLERQAKSILAGHANRDPAVTFHLGSWCIGFIGKSHAEMLDADLTLDQAQQSIAAEYGFKSWTDVQALADTPFDVTFESAVDFVVSGELQKLKALLRDNLSLSQQASQFPHNATLLHYIGANGVESHRQMTPLNVVHVTQCLIDAGADVNAEANIYGGGATTLGLLLSSAHPTNAGVVDQVAEVLRNAGARTTHDLAG